MARYAQLGSQKVWINPDHVMRVDGVGNESTLVYTSSHVEIVVDRPVEEVLALLEERSVPVLGTQPHNRRLEDRLNGVIAGDFNTDER